MELGPSLIINAELKDLERIRRFIKDKLVALKVNPDAAYDILLATEEAITNILRHSYHEKAGLIEVEFRREGNALLIYLRDEAAPFDPTQIPQPDTSLPLEKRPIGGMGVHLMRQFMDQVTHRVTAKGGNELILAKKGVINKE